MKPAGTTFAPSVNFKSIPEGARFELNRQDQFELVVPETKSSRLSVIGALVSRRSTVSAQGSVQPADPANAARNARVLAAVRAYVKPLPASESLGFQKKLGALSTPQALNLTPERFAGLVAGVVSSASLKSMEVTPEHQQLALLQALRRNPTELAHWVQPHAAGDPMASKALAQLASQEVLQRAQALLHEDRVKTAERLVVEINAGRAAQAVSDGTFQTEIQRQEALVTQLTKAHEVHRNMVRTLLERVERSESKDGTASGYLTAQLRVAQLAMGRARQRMEEAQALLGLWQHHQQSNPPELQVARREAPLIAQADETVFLARADDYVAQAWEQVKAADDLVFSEATASPAARALRERHLAQVAALEQGFSNEAPAGQPLPVHVAELRLRAGTPGFERALAQVTRIAEQLKAMGPEAAAAVAKEVAARLQGLRDGLGRLPAADTPGSEAARDGSGAAPKEFQPAIAAVFNRFRMEQAQALSCMRLYAQVPAQEVADIGRRVIELVALGLEDADPDQARRAVNSLGNPAYTDLIGRALLELSQPPATPESLQAVRVLDAALLKMDEAARNPGATERKSSPGS